MPTTHRPHQSCFAASQHLAVPPFRPECLAVGEDLMGFATDGLSESRFSHPPCIQPAPLLMAAPGPAVGQLLWQQFARLTQQFARSQGLVTWILCRSPHER